MKVNLGCGSIQPDGWVNVDLTDQGPDVVVADVTDRLPFDDESVTGVVANHSLQQIALADVPRAFAEVHRVLIRGGVLRVMVPDVVAAFEAWQANDWDWFPNSDCPPHLRLTAYATWYGTNLTPFTRKTLSWAFQAGGFVDPELVAHGQTVFGADWLLELDDRANESLFMEARK